MSSAASSRLVQRWLVLRHAGCQHLATLLALFFVEADKIDGVVVRRRSHVVRASVRKYAFHDITPLLLDGETVIVIQISLIIVFVT